jgi:hypothetical protein
MSMAIGSARSRLCPHTRFAGERFLFEEGAPHMLEQPGVELCNDEGSEIFDRSERTIKDG